MKYRDVIFRIGDYTKLYIIEVGPQHAALTDEELLRLGLGEDAVDQMIAEAQARELCPDSEGGEGE